MTKIIFSQYVKLTDKFEQYKDIIIGAQSDYARKCNCLYVLCEPDIDNYNDLQLNKIQKAEEYSKRFDQVLYLDFDVIPSLDAPNIFDQVSGLCLYPTYPQSGMREYSKLLDKQMMLASEGIDYNESILNTGVFHCDEESMNELKFTERLNECRELCDFNNEVYISYIIEKYKVKYNELDMCWNYILDNFEAKPSAAGYFQHYHHKEFRYHNTNAMIRTTGPIL